GLCRRWRSAPSATRFGCVAGSLPHSDRQREQPRADAQAALRRRSLIDEETDATVRDDEVNDSACSSTRCVSDSEDGPSGSRQDVSPAGNENNVASIRRGGGIEPSDDNSTAIDQLTARGVVKHRAERVAPDDAEHERIAALGHRASWPGHVARETRQKGR